jgi:hypothetical protein
VVSADPVDWDVIFSIQAKAFHKSEYQTNDDDGGRVQGCVANPREKGDSHCVFRMMMLITKLSQWTMSA